LILQHWWNILTGTNGTRSKASPIHRLTNNTRPWP